MQCYDAVVIGAGHNGLTCAAYFGMTGLKVKVLEKRNTIGGAAVTEEFHPGFRNSVAAYAVSLLDINVAQDDGHLARASNSATSAFKSSEIE
jgi:phytoene dehydrogenase-like protein